MSDARARAWLDAHVNLETGIGVPASSRRATAPTRDRIEALVELLGSPQLAYPVVHITGTNGKTSATRIASTVLAATGLSIGSFTSPHLERVNERIAWNGAPIPDHEFDHLLERIASIEPVLAGRGLERPSWFEIVTAAALTWFADVAVDAAVIEVGLGGTWDATNVVHGTVAVVTNVSIDHIEYLGPTREDIATEKAGIVEPGATLVLGETDPTLAPLFDASQPGVVLTRDHDFGVRTDRPAHGGHLIDLYTPGAQYPEVFLPLHGAYQADNAAAALAAAAAFLGLPPEYALVRDAFATVRSPGRLEVVDHQPLVLLDGAHNVAGAHALQAALNDEFPATTRTLVVGLLREKDPHEMLEALGVHDAALVVCSRPPSPRALAPQVVADAAAELGVDPDRVVVSDSVPEAIAAARSRTPRAGQIVVAGSLYFVGAARATLCPSG